MRWSAHERRVERHLRHRECYCRRFHCQHGSQRGAQHPDSAQSVRACCAAGGTRDGQLAESGRPSTPSCARFAAAGDVTTNRGVPPTLGVSPASIASTFLPLAAISLAATVYISLSLTALSLPGSPPTVYSISGSSTSGPALALIPARTAAAERALAAVDTTAACVTTIPAVTSSGATSAARCTTATRLAATSSFLATTSIAATCAATEPHNVAGFAPATCAAVAATESHDVAG